MRYCATLIAILTVTLNSSGQALVIDGYTVIKVTVEKPVGRIPISIFTCPVYPVFDCSEVADTMSLDLKPVYLHVPARSLQEGDLNVGDKRIHLLMVPGDTISVKLSDPSKNSKVSFNGKTKDVQLYYLFKSRKFPTSIAQQMMNAGGSTSNLAEFKVVADKLYSQEEEFWKSSIANTLILEGRKFEQGQSLPSWFIRYETDAMRYSNAMNRVYTIGYQEFVLKQKTDIPGGYFDFLKGLPLSNETAMYESAYQMFLLHYIGFKSGRSPGDNSHTIEFQFSNEVLSERVAAFYKLCSVSTSLTSSPNEVISELDKIKLPSNSQYLIDYLRGRAMSKIKKLGPGDKAPDFFLEDRIDSLISLRDFKGEVVYLSFWFAGCKPCIEEFPFENELVKKFEKKGLKVISICTHTTKLKWLEMIEKHKLIMVNLFANKAWEKRLEENYLVSAYPRYVLIGRDGRVIENFSKRPREVSKEIEIALGQ